MAKKRISGNVALKAPFPAIGGKSSVASLLWERFGDVDNFIEPFCFSAAFLLGRPIVGKVETINDVNPYVANFWRATSADPEAVAEYCDWPVIEDDLHARHRYLLMSPHADDFRARMRDDPDYYDVKVAGWWCWGACCWIGTGWCDEKLIRQDGQTTEQVPYISGLGNGVNQGMPGLHQKRPNIGNWKGVIRDGGRPQLADAFARGRGVHGNDAAEACADRREWLLEWFRRLRDRMRPVRVCCGDWKRVCDSESVTTRLGLTGVAFDPPYPTHSADSAESRAAGLYASDERRDTLDKIRDDVFAYCRERGSDPRYRIAVCGLDTDGYEPLKLLGWECVEWKSSGYQNRSEKGKENSKRERIYFSPFCKKTSNDDCPLFSSLEP